jgi:TetR/AcrR family transcriptional repressor of uid operon
MVDVRQPASDHNRAVARRDQVLCAAAECFRDHGFHGASMAELARRAGMSVGHIYHYFENKEAIIEAIVERDLARSLAFLDELARASDASAAILDLVHASVSSPEGRQRLLLRMEVLAEASRSPRVAAKVREADARARERFLEVLRAHPAFRDVPDDDLNARADGIVAILEGLTLRALRNPGLDVARVTAEMRPALAALLRVER